MIESAGPRCQYRVQQWRQEYGATMSRALRPTAAMILVGSVLVAPRPLGAEDYPNRYVRIITGGAGSFHDIVARRNATEARGAAGANLQRLAEGKARTGAEQFQQDFLVTIIFQHDRLVVQRRPVADIVLPDACRGRRVGNGGRAQRQGGGTKQKNLSHIHNPLSKGAPSPRYYTPGRELRSIAKVPRLCGPAAFA